MSPVNPPISCTAWRPQPATACRSRGCRAPQSSSRTTSWASCGGLYFSTSSRTSVATIYACPGRSIRGRMRLRGTVAAVPGRSALERRPRPAGPSEARARVEPRKVGPIRPMAVPGRRRGRHHGVGRAPAAGAGPPRSRASARTGACRPQRAQLSDHRRSLERNEPAVR